MSDTWYAALVTSSAEVIIGADLDGYIVTWNDGAAAFYGYACDEIVGQPIERLCAPGSTVSGSETRHMRKDGSVAEVHISVNVVRTPDGRLIGTSSIVRDISSLKRTQESLELAVAHERSMVDKLTDLDRIRTSFVSSVSHELRTPLTSILGYLELLAETPTGMNEHQVEMLDIVRRNSHRLFALIEDLLVLSRIESGSFHVLTEPVDVRALVGAVTREIAQQVREAGHEISLSIADNVGSVLGDPSELERLLRGLLCNAIKFTPTGGLISILADASDDGTRIVITDTGPGISEKDLTEVFEPFFRSAMADRRAIPGTGLGLSIAKSIVEQHGGSISCESESGHGTRITVLLPFAIQDRKAS